MSDYIKREDALKALREHFTDDSEGIEAESFWHYKIVEEVLQELPAADVVEKEECDACGSKTQSVIESLQKKIPTADVVEVVRGEWRQMADGACVCSVCQLGLESFTQAIFYSFCPFCGAEMRGDT